MSNNDLYLVLGPNGRITTFYPVPLDEAQKEAEQLAANHDDPESEPIYSPIPVVEVDDLQLDYAALVRISDKVLRANEEGRLDFDETEALVFAKALMTSSRAIITAVQLREAGLLGEIQHLVEKMEHIDIDDLFKALGSEEDEAA